MGRHTSRRLRHDRNGALEGLPLYLLILVVIAAVGIAIVLGWMSTLKSGMGTTIGSVSLTENGGVDTITCIGQADGTAKGSGSIVITVKDSAGKPLVGATVEILGCNVTGAKKTDGSGIANFGTKEAILPAGVYTSEIAVTVKGPAGDTKSASIIVTR